MRSSHLGHLIGVVIQLVCLATLVAIHSHGVTSTASVTSDRHWCDTIANNGMLIV
jgi:hypothetical protein